MKYVSEIYARNCMFGMCVCKFRMSGIYDIMIDLTSEMPVQNDI